MPRVRLGALGGVQAIEAGGRDLELGGRLERRALAALVAQGGKVASLDLLADAVFGEPTPPGADMRIRHHMSRLRKRLGRDVVVTASDGYRLDDGVELDWQLFEQRAAQGRSAVDPTIASDLLHQALSLWRSAPFGDLEDWPRVGALVARLTETHHAAAETRAAALLASGVPDDAIGLLEALVAEQPLRERRWMLYVSALHATQRSADALRAYQRARAALGEIGLAPSSDLTGIEREIAAGDDQRTAWRLAAVLRSFGSWDVARDGRAAVHRPLVRRDAPGTGLPVALTRVFGVADLVEKISAELVGRRLITLTGSGGVGKTRLAIEVSRRVTDDFADGVWFVDLSMIAEGDTVVSAVASALAVAPQPRMSLQEALLDWCGGRRMLLVLDNCEHVVHAARELVTAVNGTHERVAVLATSREPLSASDEYVLPVGPLIPSDAAAMFRDRAQCADAGLRLTEDDGPIVAAICGRLDGVPLAIELAAARVRGATLADLSDRLGDRSALLGLGQRAPTSRHQTVRTSVEWSYRLLTDVDRAVFERLSVFDGSFDAAAAVVVAAGDGAPDREALDAVDRLVDCSMIVADRSQRRTRYRLFETLRQFGAERLERRGEQATVRDRHLAHYVALAEENHRRWAGPEQVEADAAFESDWANLRTAHRWAIASSDLDAAQRVVAALDAHAQTRMRTEAATWAQLTLALATVHGCAGADLYGRVAHWSMYAGDHEAVIRLAEQGIGAAGAPDDPGTTLCRAFHLIALLATGRIEHARASVSLLDRAAEAAADPFVRAWAWGALCLAAPALGDADSERWIRRLEQEAAESQSPFVRQSAFYYRAMWDIFLADPPDATSARIRAERGLLEAQRVQDRQLVGQFLLLDRFVDLVDERAAEPGRLSVVIREFYATRNWLMIWIGLEAAQIVLARRHQFDVVSTIEDFLQSNRLSWGGSPRWADMRARAIADAADRRPVAKPALGSLGAHMTRDEIVSYVLERLDNAADASPTDRLGAP